MKGRSRRQHEPSSTEILRREFRSPLSTRSVRGQHKNKRDASDNHGERRHSGIRRTRVRRPISNNLARFARLHWPRSACGFIGRPTQTPTPERTSMPNNDTPPGADTTSRRDLLQYATAAAATSALGASLPATNANAQPASTPGTSNLDQGRQTMSTITTKDGTEIFYKDWGAGQPVVFSHGWPLSADDWDTQMLYFLNRGFRVIAHDRRGHGRSSQGANGHDMDHYADDLAALTAHLDLKNAEHVGHSTAGGEVLHYIHPQGE